ncbi:MAG TPA: hypothetical protein VG755_40770 [Nannocystaceae bacterium]|nr:hypothetical protein [Nannocystaceae bacterium]
MRDREPGFRPAVLQGEKRFEGSPPSLVPSTCMLSPLPAPHSERARFHAVNEPPDEPA